MLKLIKNVNVLDCTGAALKKGWSVLVDGEKIAKMGPAESVTATAENLVVYDGAGKTLMPGLIDAHVHITGTGDPNRLKAMKELVPHAAIRTAQQAKTTVEAGITTIRDAGGSYLIDVAVRDAINEGLIVGPRMKVSGQGLSITGGHGDSRNGYPPEVEFKGRSVVDSPDEARKVAREQLRDGADQIKLHATGGVLSEGDLPTARGLTIAEMKAAIEEANNVGKKTMAHAQGTSGIMNAILAGIDSIEHGCYLTDETIEEMLKRGVYLVPTLCAPYHIIQNGLKAGIPDYAVRKTEAVFGHHKNSLTIAYKAGVKIAMGTDSATPFNFHGRNSIELSLMVEAGMPPEEAIYAATRGGADLLDMADKIGTVEEGKLADLILVDGSPHEDVTILQDLQKILLVLKGGAVIANRGA